MSQGLAGFDHKVLVYSLSEFDKIEYFVPNIKRVFIKAPNFSFVEKIFLSNFSILHCLFKERVKIIIILGVSGGLSMWLSRLFGAKTILNLDGLEWRRSRWNRFVQVSLKTLERLAVISADVVIADSEAIGDYVISEYKKEPVFIPYGVDDCHYSDFDWKEISGKYDLRKDGYYLIVGRHVPENNFDTSINGFLKSNSSKKLVIVSNLKDEEAPQSESVIFTGGIYDRSKLFALRANAFAYIHGHSVGGTNPSLLEAISSKNIVFAYDVPYNREVLREHGFYFKNENDLTHFINHFESEFDDIDRKKIFEYYERILKEKYNWDIVINQYERLLH